MLAILDARDACVRPRLADATLAELSTWPDLQLAFIDASAQSADCSIAGAYIDTVAPPVIGIVQATYSRRDAFTALHELGHHLQRTELSLADDLPTQPDRGRILEEMTSDAFAAAILIPNEIALRHLGGSTPSAVQLHSLWSETKASRAAVSVRAIQNFSSPGHVVLLDSGGEIAFAATYADFPLKAGLDQSDSAIYRRIQDSAASVVSTKSAWRYANGIYGQELYAQSVKLGNYHLVVSVVDGAPWEKIALSAPRPNAYQAWHTCSACGHVMRMYGLERCAICNDPKCPECGRCACPSRVVERLCSECFLIRPAQLFSGDATVCNECLN